MADFRDFLARLENVVDCTLCLVPLPRKTVTEQNMQEWDDFCRKLPFRMAQIQAMSHI